MALPLFAPRRGPESAVPANTRAPSVLGRGAGAFGRGREIAALLLWTAALFLILGLASYAGDPPGSVSTEVTPPGANWVGPVGEICARGLVTLVGVIAWALPLELVLLGIPFVRAKESSITASRVAGDLLITIIAAALVQVGWPGKTAFGTHPAGGMIGELFGELARSLFSTVGTFLVGLAGLGLILIGRATFSFIALARRIGAGLERAWGWISRASQSLMEAWAAARRIDREKQEAERAARAPAIVAPRAGATIAVLPEEGSGLTGGGWTTVDGPELGDGVASLVQSTPDPALGRAPRDAGEPKRRRRKAEKAAAVVEPVPVEEVVEAPLRSKKRAPAALDDLPADAGDGVTSEEDVPSEPYAEPEPEAVATPDEAKPARRAPKKAPTIVDTSAALEKEVAKPERHAVVPAPAAASTFKLPSIDFLVPAKVDFTQSVDREKLIQNADKLVETLAHYGVQGKVEDILPGPTVTTYEVSPAPGTKVSKVASLADDLALALARKVRIVAPIPGKNRIGFELPNDKRVPVSLRDLIEDRRFQTLDVPLPVVLGRDILGNPVYADLASMPHVIVAGATGAGKSVGLNVMLTSLLYRRTPDELRLLMVDPKVVELAPFDRIPHMLLPVVTDMKQAATALKWAVDEMERRYQLFADAGTKNISTYNGWVERVCLGEAKNPFAKVVMAKDHNGLPEALPATRGTDEGEAPLPEKLPHIVMVVDEFADLMMQQGKEVEAAVARLAQKARAAGMHVILATQRPSVDVITGMIKANFPTRIAYRVAQKVDSRTILDEQGAEHLLGRGDMLTKMNGSNETKRVQCPWVSEEEVQLVTDYLRSQGEPVYDDNILKPRDDEEGAEAEEDAEQDALYDDAVRLVAETRRCSTSWLQRKLGLGYNRAARIVEMMERRGLVGPANGAKDREVLIDPI